MPAQFTDEKRQNKHKEYLSCKTLRNLRNEALNDVVSSTKRTRPGAHSRIYEPAVTEAGAPQTANAVPTLEFNVATFHPQKMTPIPASHTTIRMTNEIGDLNIDTK